MTAWYRISYESNRRIGATVVDPHLAGPRTREATRLSVRALRRKVGFAPGRIISVVSRLQDGRGRWLTLGCRPSASYG